MTKLPSSGPFLKKAARLTVSDISLPSGADGKPGIDKVQKQE